MNELPVSYLTAIGTAVPRPESPLDRERAVEFACASLGLGERERLRLRALYRATGIRTRYTATGAEDAGGRFELFPDADSPFPSTGVRMGLYERFAAPLGERAALDCLPEGFDRDSITHLVTVSCTGMYAPGLDIDLLHRLGLSANVQRTCVNFMGCYAAFNALRVADAFCKADPSAKALVVGVELCSLHFQADRSEDSLMAGALFADGAAALLVEGRKPEGQGRALALRRSFCDLQPNGSKHMAWRVGDEGFEMRLSSYVPDLLADKLGAVSAGLLGGLGLESVDRYAVHPGGRRILEQVGKALGVPPEGLAPSYETLRDHGNMSSVTVAFVLKRLWDSLRTGERVLGMAFGPGLTVESALMEAV